MRLSDGAWFLAVLLLALKSVLALRFDVEQIDWNLNRNRTARTPLDYSGQWDNHSQSDFVRAKLVYRQLLIVSKNINPLQRIGAFLSILSQSIVLLMEIQQMTTSMGRLGNTISRALSCGSAAMSLDCRTVLTILPAWVFAVSISLVVY